MTQVVNIPPADPTQHPVVYRVITDHPFYNPRASDGGGVEPTITWAAPMPNQTPTAHPLISGLKIVRMYVVPGASVEIFSASEDGRVGVRNTIPWRHVRLTDEYMDAGVFADEISSAENEEPEEEEQPRPPASAQGTMQPMPPANPNGVS